MAKVIKLTSNNNETFLPVTDAKYVQISYDGITKSVQDTIIEDEEVFAAALSDLNISKANVSHTHTASDINDINTLLSSTIGISYNTSTGEISIDGGTSKKIKIVGSEGIQVTGTSSSTYTLTVAHTNTLSNGGSVVSSSATLAHSGTFNVPSITWDENGHITSCTATQFTLPADSNTDTKVTQNPTDLNAYLNVLLKYSNNVNPVTNPVYFDSDGAFQYNPNTNTLKVDKIIASSSVVAPNVQPTLTFDNVPTSGSSNPVKSGGIYDTIVANEETTATAIAVLNSRITDVENNMTSNINTALGNTLNTYVSKSGNNVIDSSQVMNWAGHDGGLKISNNKIGWIGGLVQVDGGNGVASSISYNTAIFGLGGINIHDINPNGSQISSPFFYVNTDGTTSYVKVGFNQGVVLQDTKITAPRFYENSDIRLKSNIQNIAYIDNIGIYEFDMNDTHGYGFIAQDLEKSHPNLITISYDNNIGDKKSVDYNSALSLLISKLINKIDVLENRVSYLEKNK